MSRLSPKLVRRGKGIRTNPNCEADRHGTHGAFREKCRCPEAREDWRLYYKRRRENRSAARVTNGIGTQRRLQALVAIGWPASALAARLNVGQAVIGRLYHRPRVHIATAAAVRSLYDQLWDIPGPSTRSRRYAAAAGWKPPMFWDDDTIDLPRAPMPAHNAKPEPVTAAELEVLRGYHREYERLRAQEFPISAFIREQDAQYRAEMRRQRRAQKQAGSHLAGAA